MGQLWVERFNTVDYSGKLHGAGDYDDDYFVVCTGTPGVPSSVRVRKLLRYGSCSNYSWVPYACNPPDTMPTSNGDMIAAALIDRDYGNDMTPAKLYLAESFMRMCYTPGLTPAALALCLNSALAIVLANDDIIGTTHVPFPGPNARTSDEVYFPSTDRSKFRNYSAKFGRA